MNKVELQSSDFQTGDFVAYEGPYKFIHYGIVFHVGHREVALKPLSYLSSRPFDPWSISPHTLKISLDKFSKNLKNVVSHVIDEIMMDNQIIAKRKGFIKITRKTPSFRAGVQSARQDLLGFVYRVNMACPF